LQIGLNKETADWLNDQHSRMEKGSRVLVDIALNIGEVLAAVQNCNNYNFAESNRMLGLAVRQYITTFPFSTTRTK
jgi:hypothetical protein